MWVVLSIENEGHRQVKIQAIKLKSQNNECYHQKTEKLSQKIEVHCGELHKIQTF